MMSTTASPQKTKIALFNNGLYHHGREIVMGAKNYLLKLSNVQLRVIANTNYHKITRSSDLAGCR